MNLAWLVGVWGALTVLELCAIAFLLVKTSRSGSPEQLQSAVRQLSVDVEELYGAVEKWTKRRYAAEARSRIGEASAPAAPMTMAEKKALLRAKARGGMQ